MGKTHSAKVSIVQLKEQIKEAENRKKHLEEYLKKLHHAYHKKQISYSQYIETLYHKQNKRNIHEHIHNYDNHIKECKKLIKHHKKHIIRYHVNRAFIFSIILVVLIFSFTQLTNFKFTGFLTQEPGAPVFETQEFIQEINFKTSESTDYEWKLGNFSEGKLGYVKLNGLVKGEGTVKIYLEDILILDSSNFPNQKQGTIEEQYLNTSLDKINISNQTNESQEPTFSQIKIIDFSNLCEETCNLESLSLNKSSYNLKIEILNADLEIHEIKYEIIIEKPKIPETAPVIPPEENITTTEINITTEDFNITTTQLPAKINEAVKWKKEISAKKSGKIKIQLPKESTNILTREKEAPQKQMSPFQEELASEKQLTLDAQAKDYEIEYETPAPQSTEQETQRGKIIKVSSPDNVHYTDVLVFTNLSEALNIKNPSRVKIHWIEQNTFLSPSNVKDLDNNGIYDYVEFIAPSLSNQTFEIIIITKAEHLDSNRDFISDIFDQVKTLDNIWSEPIPNQDYVRVTFEVPLDNTRDITIFPRVTSGNPRIEVYEVNEAQLIAEFPTLNSNRYNKVFLTNLQGSQNTFDLHILGGSVEFDYIVDPTVTYNLLTNTTNKAFQSEQAGQDVWSGTEATGPEYYNMSYEDTIYAKICGTGTSTSNREPKWRYNFTINEATASITSLNVSWEGYDNASETGVAYAWNRTSAALVSMGNLGASNAWITVNYTGTNIANFINPTNNQLVIYVEGPNFDGGDCIFADYVRVIVYTESTPPQWFNNQTNSTLAGTPILHSVNWTDNVALSGYIFSFNNGTGTFVNDSWVSISGVSNWSNVTKVVNFTGGTTIQWMIYANDSSGNLNVTSTFSYVTTVDNPPKWQNPSTNNSNPLPGATVRHNINWTDDTALSFAKLEINSTGASCNTAANITNTSLSGTSNWANLTWTLNESCEGKTIGWKQYANDSANQWNVTSLQTYTVQNVNPTASFGTNPVDNYNSSSSSVNFELSCSDNFNVSTLQLWGNWTGTWHANQTNSSPINATTWTIQVTGIPQGSRHIWAVRCNDSASNIDWTDTNRTFTVDTTAPTVTLPVYTNATKYKNTQSMTFNISVADTVAGPHYCSINVNGNANQTLVVSSGWCNGTYALTGLTDGNKIINAYANDTVGNLALNNSYVVWIDTTAPTITLPVYTNLTAKKSSDNLLINASVTDSGVGASYCAINVATATASNVTLAVSSGWCNTSYSLAGTSEGNQIINVYSNDSLGNTALNNSYSVKIDNTAPTITFPFYTNATQKQNTETLTLNISVTDTITSPSFCNIEVNGTNTTLAASDGWCNTTSIPLTNLADGNRTINVYANDSANNWGLNNSFVVDIISQVAPTIGTVEIITAKNPTDDTTTSITFNFTATDINGASDINTSTAQAYFQRAGETTRSNTSCINLSAGVGNDINFTCTINMWYYDQNGAWTINTTILDNSNSYAENSSTTFTYNILTAMKMAPTSLTWPSLFAGNTNIGSDTDPIIINNTGNDVDLNINITAYDLRGETTTTQYIYATNLSVENASQGCSGTTMSNATSINVTSSILQRGNHTLNYLNSTSGQEELYFCLKEIPSGISPQAYSSSAYGSWEIKVLLVVLIPRRKKKKTIENDKLLKAIDLIADELKEEYSLNKKEIIEIIISKLKTKYKTSKKEILEIIHSAEEIKIPSTIFTKRLGGLEALVKYMKENLNMNYKKISELLSRNERTVWTAYKKAAEKMKEPLEIKETAMNIPLEAFKDKKLTILESTIIEMKKKDMKFTDISKLLNRDQRNIYTIYSRAAKKLKKEG